MPATPGKKSCKKKRKHVKNTKVPFQEHKKKDTDNFIFLQCSKLKISLISHKEKKQSEKAKKSGDEKKVKLTVSF